MLSLMLLLTLYAATSNPGKLAEFKSAALAEGVAIEALPNLNQIPEPSEDATTFQGNADLKAIAYSLAAPNLLVFADDSGLEVPALSNQPGVRSARFADDYLLDHPTSVISIGVPQPTTAISTGAQQPNSAILTGAQQPTTAILTGAQQPNSVPTTEVQPPNFVISTGAQRSGETPVFPLSKDARNNALLLHLMRDQTDRAARFVCSLSLARNGEVLLRAHGTVEGQLLHAPRGADGFGYDPLFLLPSLNRTSAEIPRQQKWQRSHRGNAFRQLLAQLATANL
jgi:XTP/dITP diphosphohydrolase